MAFIPAFRTLSRIFSAITFAIFTAPPMLLPAQPLCAQDSPEAAAPASDQTIEALVNQARPATVVLLGRGRDGSSPVSGTGFLISPEGLVATNLHVIGEGRPFQVRTADGKEHAVKSVLASDRRLDLAIIQLEGQDFPALELGTPEQLPQGAPVVALGHPHGLNYSVVRGILSSRRQMEGREMLQLAIPIEPGNSGGPLLDLQGRVHGILTMKSLVTENLGFAVSAEHLKQLLQNPHPVDIAVWLRRGQLDPSQWTSLFGATWKQSPSGISVDDPGIGFGGRSLCLAKREVPEVPFEIGALVKLDNESGAAGLAFHADGADQHYGFYPTAGRLRLTHFAGPNVYSWNILADVASEYYRPGHWNYLKVRIEKDQLICSVNGHIVITSNDHSLTGGQVGLVKFRDTKAEFRRFDVGKELNAPTASPADVAHIQSILDQFANENEKHAEAEYQTTLQSLAEHAATTQYVVDQRVASLEKQIEQLKQLSDRAHIAHVVNQLRLVMARPEAEINLARVALLIAQLDNPDTDVDGYLREIDRLAGEIQTELKDGMSDREKLDVLHRQFFDQYGFHGGRVEYYTAENSYLDRVIDDREGLPITLSILYMELAGRLGLSVEGVGLPGHFIVRFRESTPARAGDSDAPDPAEHATLIDVFNGGTTMTRDDAEIQARLAGYNRLTDDLLAPASKKSIATRILRNLTNLARKENNAKALEGYIEAMLAIDEQLVDVRLMRAIMRHEQQRTEAAIADLDWILEHAGETVDLDAIEQLKQRMQSVPATGA
jgi:regulator of sirC expression with transglutaminase-like and TPR domain/S1-C subfamily serine protease